MCHPCWGLCSRAYELPLLGREEALGAYQLDKNRDYLYSDTRSMLLALERAVADYHPTPAAPSASGPPLPGRVNALASTTPLLYGPGLLQVRHRGGGRRPVMGVYVLSITVLSLCLRALRLRVWDLATTLNPKPSQQQRCLS